MSSCKFVSNFGPLWYLSVLKTSSSFLKPSILRTVSARDKGHSKWQNIRHIKEAKDREKSHIFNRLIALMKQAIVEGGSSDPEFNSKLAQIVDSAKRSSMPTATIQNVLKGSKEKPLQSVWFEIKGPKGSMFYLSTLSPNFTLVKQQLRSTCKKYKSVEFTDGNAKHIFEYKGIILASPPVGLENIEETSLEHAIETGAEEVVFDEEENILEFTTAASSMHLTRKKLEDLKYEIKEADCVYIPRVPVKLSGEEEEEMSALYSKLNAIPEVVTVYTNF